jgi:DNA repair protein RecO (recombination protein O)
MLKKDEAICIRTIDYSETSQILTLFCKETGKVGAIAKGARRAKSPFGGPIEVFSHGHIVFSEGAEGKLSTLTEFERRGDFAMLRRDLLSLNAAFFGAEMVNSLTTDKDPHPDVFDDFLSFLGNLEQATGNAGSLRLLIIFQLSILGRLGTGLVLGSCANCSKGYETGWASVFFSSTAHGILCPDCEGSFPDRLQLGRQAVGCLSELQSIANASEKVLYELEKVLILHLTYVLHHPPRMAKYFLQA